MTNPLREPILPHQRYVVREDVQAALMAEKLWLCGSGELEKIYLIHPCFNSRSAALDRLCNARLAQKFVNEFPIFVCHCHDDGLISMVLQVSRRRDKPEAAADTTINLNLLKLHEERV